MSFVILLLSFCSGAFLWSLSEYILHRWVGHGTGGRNLLSREHLAHHHNIMYFAPTWKKALTALSLACVMGSGLVWLLAWDGVALVLGYLVAYAGYEFLHRRIHTHTPRGAYSRWARRHHYYHHFSGPRYNHGVTSPLWDVVFRTYRQPGLIRVPQKHAMPWLLDPQTSDVFTSLSCDYRLARQGEKRVDMAKVRAAFSKQKSAQAGHHQAG